MTEFLIYLGITLFSLLLFYWWYKKTDTKAEKKWLLQQLNSAESEEQVKYANALKSLEQQSKASQKGLSTTLWMALMIAPATFAIDYIWFQTIPLDERISVADLQNNQQEPPDLATAIAQLESKLAENPNDLEGQMLYGIAMMQLQRYENAVGAYRKANEIEPNNAHILTELAEAIAFKNNTGSFLGEPEPFLEQAISINPSHQKAMWLQGIVLYEKLEYAQAEAIWSELLEQVESPNIRQTITTQINQARAALDKQPLDELISAQSLNYLVVIDADEAVKQIDLPPTARIFVYAKELNGMPMPIAATPITQPFNWPLSVRLSDRQNLNPARKLSDFEQVEFSAKLSLSGNATPSADDINSDLVVGDQDSTNIKLTLEE
ncbi:tetratricopeptide repeat protein [Marinicella sp. S1101]|uniref:tetratricopeptide repeat protein n=1 Tax=Marinicella marina TaxID=2996016 RepID=UPI002260ED89|nr:tetratricopeptide repeat protein [Marinicella marina]MCX7554509.1 tetratricopeptide repeat protein [Marinicella marina]MDJ1140660.1 tetratricopeptide repeat protein [Marinicella marina]